MGKRATAPKGILARQDVAPRTGNKVRARTREKASRPERSAPAAPASPIGRGILAVLCMTLAVASTLAVLSYRPSHPALNLIGRAGHGLATVLLESVGLCAYLVPFPLFSLAGSLASADPTRRRWTRVIALAVLALCGSTLAHLIIGAHSGLDYPPGGWVGIHLGGELETYLSFWGAVIAICAVGASAAVVTSEGWLVRAGVATGAWLETQGKALAVAAWKGAQALAQRAKAYHQQRREERREEAAYLAQVLADEEEPEDADEDADPLSVAEQEAEEAEGMAAEADGLTEVSDRNRRISEAAPASRKTQKPAPVEAPEVKAAAAAERPAEGVTEAPEGEELGSRMRENDPAWTLSTDRGAEGKRKDKKAKKGVPAVSPEQADDTKTFEADKNPLPRIVVPGAGTIAEVPFDEGAMEVLAVAQPEDALRTSQPPQPARPKAEAKKAAPPPPPAPTSAAASQAAGSDLPAIIERPQPEIRKKKVGGFQMADGHTSFVLPPLDLLDLPEEKKQLRLDKDVFFATAEKLRLKLKDFGIDGEVKEIHPGPVVTMYEFVPGPGIKISKIAALADDLAMAMEALRVRIVAPIPGKGSVGIEVPNRERETVYLKELVESDKYAGSTSKLTMCLGKNIEGMPYVMDLAKAPHLLMAGTTGSGKSVSVNSMIMSILLKATPEEVRFLMIDPKMLELSIYEGIPHLLLPVVTDSKKAALGLRWAVEEMERRYQLMSDVGVRNLAGYNKLVEAGMATPAKPQEVKPDARIVVDVSEGAPSLEAPAEAAPGAEEKPHKLPYIVVIIDELADLMMVASREVETYIARLAQMARAAGIHLMAATQRPSTDVVTGVIKANFPSRISFMLRSKPDSMTILGQTGAEALLGMGDMLVMPPTDSNVIRVHGAFVSEPEIKRVVDHLKAQGKPVYDETILRPREEEGADGGGPEEDDLSDDLYDQALAIVGELRDVSISVLQRKMRIGYNRSARMIERMERDGVVGPADGSKPRRVLIRPVGEMPGAGAV